MADLTGEAAQGTLETRKDAGKGEAAEVKFWIDAIALASKEEEKWRETAAKAYAIYSADCERAKAKKATFNILYSNVETIVPAVYNSTPVPDIRPRDLRVGKKPQQQPAPQPGMPTQAAPAPEDPTLALARDAAPILERTLTALLDQYDFDLTVETAVRDQQIGGRGITRVRYEPVMAEDNKSVAYQATYCENVIWEDFRRGPAKRWSDVPWIAFRHYMTRAQLEALSETNGGKVPLDHSIQGESKDASKGPEGDVFKRALVWEIWDKGKREVVFVAPSFPKAFVSREADPLKLRGFYPIPRPLHDINRPDDLVPVCPFTLYEEQANELDEISKRIRKLTKAIKAKGLGDASLAAALRSLGQVDDGEIAPIDQTFATAQMGGIEKAIWFMPIEAMVETLAQLVAQREQIKQTIYEIIGISDILRGQVDPREKAQQSNLKAQWGASRLHTRQKEAARYARDLIRIMSEIIAEHFEPQILQVISAMPVTPEHSAFMKNDALMSFRVDIETDSTIQADTQRTQQNVGQFVQGFGTFMQAMGPAVQAGFMPVDVAADMLKSFARVFKLGKQAEDALERLGEQAAEQAQQPKQDPEMAKAEAEIQRKNQEAELKAQVEQHKLQLAEQKAASDRQIAELKMQLEQQRMAMEAASKQQELAMQAEAHQQTLAMDAQAQQQEMALRERTAEQDMAMSAERSQREMALAEEEARQSAQIRAKESQASIAAKRQQARSRPKGTGK